MSTEILVDVGGTISFDPRESLRPTSATVTIYNPSGSTLQAATAATVDAVDTTLSSAAAAGATTVVVASASGIVAGRAYLLTNQSRQHEWVFVTKVASTTLTVAESLVHAYAGGDTFRANQLTYAVSSALAATRATGYRAAWAYVLGATTYRASTFFDVVRSKWPAMILRADRFKAIAGKLARDILVRPGLEGRDFEDEIAEATREVRTDLLARKASPSLFLGFEQFERAVAYRVLRDRAAIGDIGKGFDPEVFEHWERQYDLELGRALAATQTYDADDDGGLDEDEQSTTPAIIRMVR